MAPEIDVTGEPERRRVPPRARILGSLLGLAIGDALGMPVEGWTREKIERTHGWIDGYLPKLRDDGTVELPAGEFTDDTEVALCHVEGLLGSGASVDPEAVGRRLIRLARGESARLLDPTTRAAVAEMEETDRFQGGAALAGPPSGSVTTQVVPVALAQSLGHFNPEMFCREVARAALLTHGNLESLNGALAIAYAIRLLVTDAVPPEVLIDEVAAFIEEDRVARRLRVAAALARHRDDRARDRRNLAEIGTTCDVAECVPAALYAFVTHADDFAEAVLAGINGGGDTDTIGALVGALAGAHLGASAIPTQWVEGLEGRMYILVAGPGLYRLALTRAGLVLQLRQPE